MSGIDKEQETNRNSVQSPNTYGVTGTNHPNVIQAGVDLYAFSEAQNFKLPMLENLDNYKKCNLWYDQAVDGLKTRRMYHLFEKGEEITKLIEKKKSKESDLDDDERKLLAQDQRAVTFLTGSMSTDVLEKLDQERTTYEIMDMIKIVIQRLGVKEEARSFENFRILKYKKGDDPTIFVRKFRTGLRDTEQREPEKRDMNTFLNKIPSDIKTHLTVLVANVNDGKSKMSELMDQFKSIAHLKNDEVENDEVNLMGDGRKGKFANGNPRFKKFACGHCQTNDHRYFECKHIRCMNCDELGHPWRKCQRQLSSYCQQKLDIWNKVNIGSSSISPKPNELITPLNSTDPEVQDSEPVREIEEESIKPKDVSSQLNNVDHINVVEEHVGTKDVWIIDSGATAHVTWMYDALVNVRPVTKGLSLADGTMLYSEQMGDVVLRQGNNEQKLVLKNVCYIPEIAKNVISVRALGPDYETVMTDELAVVKLKTKTGMGKIMLVAPNKSKLYQTEVERCMIMADDNDERMLYHKRLGHVGIKKLKETLGIPVHDSEQRCESCLICKHKRRPFTNSDSVSDNVLDLVHIDITGPINLESVDGKRFVLVVIDDYSRFAEIALIHRKSDALGNLLDILKRWSVRTGREVKTLRSDNAKEFVSEEFKMKMAERGISRHLTVVYNPEQNGVAERTIGVIKEITRVIMFEKKLPDWIWPYAMKHATLIRNICQSASTTRIPYKDWFKKEFDYDTLKIFGSLAYGHIPLVKQTTLGPTARKSIFLGFEDGVKGYLLYDLDQRVMYTSRSVKFSEWADLPEISAPTIKKSVAMTTGTSGLSGTRTDPDAFMQEEEEASTPEGTDTEERTVEEQQQNTTAPSNEDTSGSDTAIDSPTPEPRSPDDLDNEVQGGVNAEEDVMGEPHEPEMTTESHDERLNEEDESHEPSEADMDLATTDDESHNNDGIDGYHNSEGQSETESIEENEANEMREYEVRVTDAGNARLQKENMEQVEPRRSERIKNLPTISYNTSGWPATRKDQAQGSTIQAGAKQVHWEYTDDEFDESRIEVIDENLDTETFNYLVETGDESERIFAIELKEVECEPDPKTLKEALRGPMRMEWQAAADKEIGTIMSMNAIKRIIPGPEDRVIPTKMHVQVKRDERHRIIARKVRFVAKGFMQEEGRDFKHSFAPTASADTLRALLTMAASLDWEIEQMDVSAAYLHADLEERVVIEPPEGYESDPNVKWLLLKALYGLRQAPRAWYELVVQILTKLNFTRLMADMCVFTRGKGEQQLIVVIHVDDFLVLGKDIEEIQKVKYALGNELEIKDLGAVTRFLNLVIKRDRQQRVIELSQEHSIEEIGKDYIEHRGYTATTPVTKNSYEEGDMCNYEKSAKYLQIYGALNYVGTWSRPDICYGMSLLGQYIKAPTTDAYEALLKMLHYVVTTKGDTLKLGNLSTDELVVYTDADWAKDTNDRKSRTGMLLMLNSSPIQWKSKKQSVVARSTAEAEYLAAATGARELVWLMNLLSECNLKTKQKPTLFTDNQAIFKILENATSSKRLRHLDLPYHEIRNLVSRDEVNIKFVRSKDQLADMLTKAVPETTINGVKKILKMMTLNAESGRRVVNFIHSLFEKVWFDV